MAVWDVADLLRQCVCRVEHVIRRSGGVVRGRLRRPYRPLQVNGVLAAVLPNARKSLMFNVSIERAGRLPIPAKIELAESGERLHANTAPILWGGPSASQRSIRLLTAPSRTNSSRYNHRTQGLRAVGFAVRSELESMGGDHELFDAPRPRQRYSIDRRAALGA
jgi:hypothetical protein